MSKIKQINERLHKNPEEYGDFRFLVIKRLFAFCASSYFLCYLFTVGGFYFGPFSLDRLSIVTYHLYSLLVIATLGFFYMLVEYFSKIYAPRNKKIYCSLAGFFVLIFGFIALATHLGFFSFS